ncbi:MAG: hypothetical protein HPY59_02305 [Anaerolineae bacterium]|nr:hypothetical protein [Anaerolineae bacterium]
MNILFQITHAIIITGWSVNLCLPYRGVTADHSSGGVYGFLIIAMLFENRGGKQLLGHSSVFNIAGAHLWCVTG